MNRYKNVSEMEQRLIGYGPVAPGEEFDTEMVVENPNFKFIAGAAATAAEPLVATTAPQPNMVTDVLPASAQSSTENKES